MTIAKYGTGLTYGGSNCVAPIYGVSADVTGNVSGTITNIQEWTGTINLTGNVIIQSNAAVVIACDTYVKNNGFIIITQDGGYLNTRKKRLPGNSNIGSVLIIT
jgi:hypothetical protein